MDTCTNSVGADETVHNKLSLQDLQFAALSGSFMPGEIIQTSLQLPLNIVSVLCKSGNQSNLYRVANAKGANPNQFITDS